jgi:hypothetical protein
VQAYINEIGWAYDRASIARPADGSKPQPTISVTKGLECRLCPREHPSRPFKTSNWKVMKNHGIEVHKRQRVGKRTLCWEVRLQSWFRGGGEEWYWRVDETLRESDRNEGDRMRETPVIGPSATVDDVVEVVDGEDIGAVSAADEEATIVVDDGVIVISSDGSDDEVLVSRKRRAVIASDSDDSDQQNGIFYRGGMLEPLEGFAADIRLHQQDHRPRHHIRWKQ